MQQFKFVSAVSEHPSLYQAVASCAHSVRQQLAPLSPTFALLCLNMGYRGPGGIGHAPAVAMEQLCEGRSGPPPVLIGGCFSGVYGGGRLLEGKQGAVTLLAGVLPLVTCHPFHASTPSLPSFSRDQWQSLLSSTPPLVDRHPAAAGAAGAADDPAAAARRASHGEASSSAGAATPRAGGGLGCVMLSVPHFVEVEQLLTRLGSALPGMQVVGGVSEPSAWTDTEHQHGALFIGDRTVSSGAVGCVLQGPLTLQPLLQPSCRPLGPVCRVTRSERSYILQLDDRPVQEMLEVLLRDKATGRDGQRDLLLGVDDAGGGEYVARLMSVAMSNRGPVIAVAAPQVPVGSTVQLQVRDWDFCRQQLRLRLEEAVEQLPFEFITPAPPSAMAALCFSCVGVPHSEADTLTEALPHVATGGARVQGEFGSAVAHGAPKLHSYVSSVALLHPSVGV